MKCFLLLALGIFVLASCDKKEQTMQIDWPELTPPTAFKKEHFRTIHGDTVSDPYYWMYDYFGKGPDSQNVVDYLNAENQYLKAMMAPTDSLQASLFEEMKGRIKEKDESVPYLDNGYYYYTRTEDGQEYYKLCRKKGGLDAAEEVILDVDEMAKGKPYFDISDFAVSPDNKMVAFGADEVSRRQYTLYVKNLETGELLQDKIENTEGDPVWANDNRTLFYTAKNPVTLLSEKIYAHKLGNAAQKDKLVYEEADKSNYIGVYRSKNGQWILIHSQATLSSEVRILDANQPDKAFKVFEPRMKETIYSVTPLDDRFLILTNEGDAENFKVMECPLDATGKDNWNTYIPHSKDVLIEGLEEFADFVVVQQRRKGLTEIEVRNLKNGENHSISFDEPTYDASVTQNKEYKTDGLRFRYTSLITPSSIYDYDLGTKDRKLMKQQEVLGGYDPSQYESERLYATARDGVEVPISIVYKKGFRKNGKSPVLEYAYGSYGYSMDASFSSARLSLLDRGFAYAIAHIRGGQELGRKWYLDGKLMKKENTFYDFIDCGKYLIEKGYTSAEHLYANGGSAGGLLMGAVANMAPEQYNGIIADVPFVDVVNTMLDEDIPLTTNEYDEWGNPNEKEAYFYMKSYSPYENVEAKAYPNILVTTGLHDSQVQYFEPAKWVAKLREMKTDNKLLLLKTNMDFGHGGASGRFDYLHDVALRWAFFCALEGIQN
ncbi:S9 family peptidase [Marinilongibacter aquaticus]|uniref:S9 family peptidase n=1 Tax=Marinilongibacter aquaticus TaxID=2975157 RepID=UPI0021BDC935|nr:S9 family peptidase [Marinilongibacter aquaticus]UBM59890.1 S9 family peptidase [Marinilongibacter aquaticus]